jgi:hypothetical protein
MVDLKALAGDRWRIIDDGYCVADDGLVYTRWRTSGRERLAGGWRMSEPTRRSAAARSPPGLPWVSGARASRPRGTGRAQNSPGTRDQALRR